MTSKPRITLRGVKYARFASKETDCFTATVEVDGTPFCRAENDGHGGATFFQPLKGGKMSDLRDAIAEVGTRINPNAARDYADFAARFKDRENSENAFDRDHWYEVAEGITAEQVLEAAVGRALMVWLIAKDLKRAMRTKILAKVKSGGLFEWRYRGNLNAAIEAVKQRQAAEGDPVETVLNLVPIEQAVELARTSGA